mmetsp:Transcript_47844/g.147525  ORF Transcript_47844/g.147525 Transcript_47844/m.147525 type:complete len:248 (-) Transcript_47844:896-1639(-)
MPGGRRATLGAMFGTAHQGGKRLPDRCYSAVLRGAWTSAGKGAHLDCGTGVEAPPMDARPHAQCSFPARASSALVAGVNMTVVNAPRRLTMPLVTMTMLRPYRASQIGNRAVPTTPPSLPEAAAIPTQVPRAEAGKCSVGTKYVVMPMKGIMKTQNMYSTAKNPELVTCPFSQPMMHNGTAIKTKQVACIILSETVSAMRKPIRFPITPRPLMVSAKMASRITSATAESPFLPNRRSQMMLLKLPWP